ncbi:MAG: preprotein translocase subunit SecA [Candidatus Puniceispirillaceae bacterium]
MLGSLAKSLFGSPNDREIKRLGGRIDAINAKESHYEAFSDDDLRDETARLKEMVANGTSLDDILVDAFALVREGAKRTLGQRHFDVQLMGGIILHEGKISEMKTGEGKTLVATLPVFLNALTGKGVHVVTVNDYLATRDAGWMGQVYEFLGLSVGVIIGGITDEVRRAAYQADITYGTNNEFGFDYLRDNLKFELAAMVQRDHHFAIVDEVDSILIDEARTPLVISGPAETAADLYVAVNQIVPHLEEADYEKDEKTRSVTLTETGVEHVEDLCRNANLMEDGSLYDTNHVTLLHHVTQALRAHQIFERDTHYMVRAGQVVIIDEFTGRAMDGRRFSDGLHQALEAKEAVEIQAENQTLASVTYQNYFRLYEKLAGMTGTALTEAGEFSEIYKLDVVAIPTNRGVARIDSDDEVYRTSEERDNAVITLIEESRAKGQPVLVGTVTIEKSESLSKTLTKKKIPHKVLNARFHEEEAQIIAQAGVPGAVTIATNMAGRGTDIQLGGNLEMRLAGEGDKLTDKKRDAITAEVEALKQQALDAGGLYVIGTERHESRRIDNQLRGRTGRQGDPGASKFFLSLQDDLMRIFGSEKLDGMLQKLGLDEGEAITHSWINKAVEKAQSKVEAHNFEIRKQLLRFDDVMNDQRQVIFAQRKDIMESKDVHETVVDMRRDVVEAIIDDAIPQGSFVDQWDADKFRLESAQYLGLDVPASDWFNEDGVSEVELSDRLHAMSDKHMAEKALRFGPDVMRMAEKSLLLQVLDQQWKEHLLGLDQLRQGIGLRAYAQRDPLNEYKKEAFGMFEGMLERMRRTVTLALAHVEMRTPEQAEAADNQTPAQSKQAPSAKKPAAAATASSAKVGRNEPCPCGSGKKYKHCHGAIA